MILDLGSHPFLGEIASSRKSSIERRADPLSNCINVGIRGRLFRWDDEYGVSDGGITNVTMDYSDHYSVEEEGFPFFSQQIQMLHAMNGKASLDRIRPPTIVNHTGENSYIYKKGIIFLPPCLGH